MRSIQRKRSLKNNVQEEVWKRTGENDVTEAEGKKKLRKSKWLRVSNVTEKSREIMT